MACPGVQVAQDSGWMDVARGREALAVPVALAMPVVPTGCTWIGLAWFDRLASFCTRFPGAVAICAALAQFSMHSRRTHSGTQRFCGAGWLRAARLQDLHAIHSRERITGQTFKLRQAIFERSLHSTFYQISPPPNTTS